MTTQTTNTTTATAKQIAFLASLTGRTASDFANLTKRDASVLIGKTLKEQRTAKPTAKRSKQSRPAAKPTETVEGVKVGDVFSMSWGYDCTINNSFEVVEIMSDHTVKVRELGFARGECWSPASGTEYTKRGNFKDRSTWSRNGSQPINGADPVDENLFTRKIQASRYCQGKSALYICFGFGGKSNHRAYFDENPERARYCSEY